MITKDLYKKVRRIQITTSRLVSDVFAGQYHSVFKGRGMEFDEVREYQFGDDIRSIDWNVTARTGRPHIKKYIEERELTVMVLLDASRSCHFASVNMLKNKLAAELAAVLAFSAIRNNDKVGLIVFTDRIEKFIPPRKGVKNVLRVIREALFFDPQGKGTDIDAALEYLNKVTTRKAVTFLISDFFPSVQTNLQHFQEQLKKSLTIAHKKHDLIAVTLNDPREENLPSCGLLRLEDAESGQIAVVDSTSTRVRETYRQRSEERKRERKRMFHSIGMDCIDIDTDKNYSDALVKFFQKRRRRR